MGGPACRRPVALSIQIIQVTREAALRLWRPSAAGALFSEVTGWDADPLTERLPPAALCRGRCRGPGESVVLATPTSDLAQDNFCFSHREMLESACSSQRPAIPEPCRLGCGVAEGVGRP